MTDDPRTAPEEEHPSYGTIQVGRVSGRTHLFDSEAEHQNFIHVTITRASVARALASDFIHPRQQLIEIWMSEAQWAHHVSSMNLGAGTPCTLHWFGGEYLPAPPVPKSAADTFSKDMRATLREYEQHLDELDALVTKMQESPSPKKSDLNKLAHELSVVRGRFTANTKFVAEQFGEHVEESMLKARQEIEAYFVNRVQQLGLAAQDAQMPVSLPDHTRLSQELAEGNPDAWNKTEEPHE